MGAAQSWPICQTCRGIPCGVFVGGTNPERIVHLLWPTFAAFAGSADRGCHVCTLLYQEVEESQRPHLESAKVYLECKPGSGTEDHEVTLTADLTSLPGCPFTQEAGLSGTSGGETAPCFTPIAHVKSALDLTSDARTTNRSRDVVGRYDDHLGAVQHIQKSLAKCLAEHDGTCDRVIFPLTQVAMQAPKSTDIVFGDRGLVVAPTRLVYVGSGAADDPPRLVAGEECLRKGGYFALSYCWGLTPDSAPWQLTSKTQRFFAQQIPTAALPQTLYDAIQWTRQLGSQYIWIDSMCIIQDSREDWQREASRMATIYGSATLTLVAASSSVYGGITDRESPLRDHAAALHLLEGSQERTVYILPSSQDRKEPDSSPTESRGWCYQEDLLSSRVVKFSRDSLRWECVGDGGVPNPRAQGLEQLSKHPSFRWYTLWYRLVERYSNRRITYGTDRLLAFHGIGSDKAGRNYVAGLISTDPWASMLWCRDEDQIERHPGRRHEEYVAPSWSWASVDAPVLFPEAKARHWRQTQLDSDYFSPELHSMTAEAALQLETGAVKAGKVELTAHAVVCQTAVAGPGCAVGDDALTERVDGRRNLYDLETEVLIGSVMFDVAADAEDDLVLYCLLLHTVDAASSLESGTAGLGIAVKLNEPTPEEQPVSYSRVGYAQYRPAFVDSAMLCKRRFTIV